MATFRGAPASQHFSFQLPQVLHQLWTAEQVLLELLDASFPSVLVDLEGIGPLTSNCALHIVILPSDVDMIGVFQPLQQVFVAHLAQELHLNVYHSRLAALLFLYVFNLLRLFLHLLFLRLLLLFPEDLLLLFGLEELLLNVLHFLGWVHYSLTNNAIISR